MTESKPTLGQAIDQIVGALQPFDPRERQTILHTVCVHLQIELGMTAQTDRHSDSRQRAGSAAQPSEAPSPIQHLGGRAIDIRSLKDEKKPNSARQMACLVAYYLQDHAPENERKQAIGIEDLEKYFKQANFKLPTKLEQLLNDCKRGGYFESAARGEYRLTRVGYNLVTHGMPSKTPT